MTSLRRLKLSRKRYLLREVSEMSQKHLSKVFVIFQNYPTKMVSCDFRMVIIISDKIDVKPLEKHLRIETFSGSSAYVSIKYFMNISGMKSA